MAVRLSLLLFCLLGISFVASAQNPDPIALLQQFPACAQSCALEQIFIGTCSPTDMQCICTNQELQSSVTQCVTHNCTVIEALATKNASLSSCNAPIRAHGPGHRVLTWTMIILVTIFVMIRFAFKIFEHHDLGDDDWAVLATLCGAIACHAVSLCTIDQGLGRDLWTLRPEQITQMLLLFEILAVLYFAELMLLKLSMIFFYIKVFTTPRAARLLWGTALLTFVWGAVYIIVATFQCQPISYFWTQWDGMHKGKCLDINAITTSNAAISIALDLWNLGIPLWQLWGLNMHWKRKVGVALMFGVGTFVTIVSILRLQALVNFARSSNVSWEFYAVQRWSTIEIGVGTICTCLPTIRQLFVRLFPALDGSSRTHQQYRKYGTAKELDGMKGRNFKAAIPGDSALSGLSKAYTGGGITVMSSFTVGRSGSDADDINLVERALPH